MRVITHKMAYRKACVTCFWGHNSLILACTQLQPKKGRSLIVVQSFGVQLVCIRLILFELCVKEKKKEEERKKEEEEQNRDFRVRFSQL